MIARQFYVPISRTDTPLLTNANDSGGQMTHAIIRGNNVRRHEVDFGRFTGSVQRSGRKSSTRGEQLTIGAVAMTTSPVLRLFMG